MILSMGVMGGMGYLVYKNRQEQQQVTVTVQPAAMNYAPQNGSSFKDLILGSIGGILAQPNNGTIVNSTGQGGFGDFLNGIFGGTAQPVGGTTANPTTSTDYGKTPFGQTQIGHRLKIDLMRDFGFTSNQAAGVVGNLHMESAGFSMLQEIQPMEWQNGVLVPSSTNKGGYGYAQWTGVRRRAFEAWAKAQNLPISGYAANYGFLRHEMTKTSEKRVVGRLKNTSTVRQAAIVFEETYLRAGIVHPEMRAAFAERYA